MPSGHASTVEALWDPKALAAAAGGRSDGIPCGAISGCSIDTRTLRPGDLFVALRDQRDGHDFVSAAFRAGASAALVSTDYVSGPDDGALIRVADTLAALRAIAAVARARLAPEARVVAITGSAGKTGTTAMLRACLATCGPTHAPEKSFNNHWGVPLTLARMPADTKFAVIEIGMNHAGEISPLTRLVRPHIAIVTNVLPVHVGNFSDGEIGIADAKAEILEGLVPGGTAILPRDSIHFQRLADAARRCGARIVTFGLGATADVHPTTLDLAADSTRVALGTGETWHVGMPGQHIAVNSLAVVTALRVSLDADAVRGALQPLGDVRPGAGRGERGRYVLAGSDPAHPTEITLIDESYNANPASMRAALAILAGTVPDACGRRIAVLGDMRELGDQGAAMHVALAESIAASGVDLVFACGPLMRGLYDVLDVSKRGAYSAISTGLVAPLAAALRTGDVVMVKGSLGTDMAPIVKALKSAGRAA